MHMQLKPGDPAFPASGWYVQKAENTYSCPFCAAGHPTTLRQIPSGEVIPIFKTAAYLDWYKPQPTGE